MTRTAKRIWNIFISLIVLAFVVLAVLLAGIKLFGITPLCVLSGSMEPTYKTGSMIYVKKAAPESIKANEPITFYMTDGKTVATHRVVNVDNENNQFHTKGDANNIQDSTPVSFSNLIGTPVFTIPYLGYLAAFVSQPVGKFASIGIGGLLILLVFVPEMVERSKTKSSKKNIYKTK